MLTVLTGSHRRSHTPVTLFNTEDQWQMQVPLLQQLHVGEADPTAGQLVFGWHCCTVLEKSGWMLLQVYPSVELTGQASCVHCEE
jgi:hypothetical protein